MKHRVQLLAVTLCAFVGVSEARTLQPPTQQNWVEGKKYVQINPAVRMAYVEWGDPAGAPVILIHGYSDNSRAFSTVAPFLHGKRFLAVDLRGHGNSSQPACCYYASDLAEDISDFIQVMGYKNAAVVGHSLGSITAGVLASIHPDLVSKLVLISSTTKPGPGTDFLYDTLHQQRFPLDIHGEFMSKWAPDSSGKDHTMLARLRLEEAAVPQRVWLGIVEALEILDWSKAARHITAPTLILWGDQDGFMLESDQDALRKALPKARFLRYPGLGHSMYWEQPERCAKDLLSFLQ